MSWSFIYSISFFEGVQSSEHFFLHPPGLSWDRNVDFWLQKKQDGDEMTNVDVDYKLRYIN